MEGILYFIIAFLIMALIGSMAHEKSVIKRKNSIIKDLTDLLDDELPSYLKNIQDLDDSDVEAVKVFLNQYLEFTFKWWNAPYGGEEK